MNYQKLIDEMITMAQEEKTVIDTIKIEKNATVEGRTGEYEVDLLWEFVYNENKYKIIVDFKNMNKQLPQNELFNFVNLTNDISGFVTGVSFTKPVYDKVVQNVAKDAGIFLYEIDLAEENNSPKPQISNVKIDVDKEWVAQAKKAKGLENENIRTSSDPRHLFVCDNNGNCVESLEAIFNKYLEDKQEDGFNENIEHKFTTDTFLTTNHEVIDKIKINSVKFDLDFMSVPQYDPQEIIRKIANFAVGKSLN